MFDQLFIGTVVTLFSVVVAAVMWWGLIQILHKMEPWLGDPPHPAKTIFAICFVVSWTMLLMTLGVWFWALVFVQLATFPSMEEAVYYSLVAYTTLGLGDVLVPKDWRLLGGMTGANGFLMFGMMTAMLTDTLRDLRRMRWSDE